MAVLDLISGIAKGLSGVADLGFGIYDRINQANLQDQQLQRDERDYNFAREQYDYQKSLNARDFDYQKALQEQIFNREDTAVARRAADLESAGLNKNLAAGSAAGAGSVVSRSNSSAGGGYSGNISTNAISNTPGADLDVAKAILQTRTAASESEIAKQQANQADTKTKSDNLTFSLAKIEALMNLGVPIKELNFGKDGNIYAYTENVRGNETVITDPFRHSNSYDRYSGAEMPALNMFMYGLQNAKNSAEMLQKSHDWQQFQYIMNAISQGVGTATDLAGAVWKPLGLFKGLGGLQQHNNFTNGFIKDILP